MCTVRHGKRVTQETVGCLLLSCTHLRSGEGFEEITSFMSYQLLKKSMHEPQLIAMVHIIRTKPQAA